MSAVLSPKFRKAVMRRYDKREAERRAAWKAMLAEESTSGHFAQSRVHAKASHVGWCFHLVMQGEMPLVELRQGSVILLPAARGERGQA